MKVKGNGRIQNRIGKQKAPGKGTCPTHVEVEGENQVHTYAADGRMDGQTDTHIPHSSGGGVMV